MYVVFSGSRLVLITPSASDAAISFETLSERESNTKLVRVKSLDELWQIFVKETIPLNDNVDTILTSLVDGFGDVLQKLDGINLDTLKQKTKENTSDFVNQVRTVGVKGMKVIGDQFIALGEKLRNSTNDSPKE